MTSPSQDVPLAEVKIGPTEVTHWLLIASSVLTVLFGKDYGLSQNVQTIAAVGAVVLTFALGLFRSTKHKAVLGANAQVIAAGNAPVSPAPVADAGRHSAEVGSDLAVDDLTVGV